VRKTLLDEIFHHLEKPFAGKIMEKICTTDFPKWKKCWKIFLENKFKNFSNFVRNFSKPVLVERASYHISARDEPLDEPWNIFSKPFALFCGKISMLLFFSCTKCGTSIYGVILFICLEVFPTTSSRNLYL